MAAGSWDGMVQDYSTFRLGIHGMVCLAGFWIFCFLLNTRFDCKTNTVEFCNSHQRTRHPQGGRQDSLRSSVLYVTP